MSTVARREQAKRLIDAMSDAQLRVASEFLAFVNSRAAATRELMSLPGFERSFPAA